jgi:hypothetical protein
MPPPAPYRPAAVVGGWTVAARSDRVWLHHARPDADGDLSPDAAEALAAALELAADDARRPLIHHDPGPTGLSCPSPSPSPLPGLRAPVELVSVEFQAAGLDPHATGRPPL